MDTTDQSDNDKVLTSTMDDVLTMSKDEKNDTDATPTSSTDASTTSSTVVMACDDPISSTSSEVNDQNKIKKTEVKVATKVGPPSPRIFDDVEQTLEQEAEMLQMDMSGHSNEKITEDVEDLVQDLENLLGESTDSFNIPKRSSFSVQKDYGKKPNTTETNASRHVQETKVDQSSDTKIDVQITNKSSDKVLESNTLEAAEIISSIDEEKSTPSNIETVNVVETIDIVDAEVISEASPLKLPETIETEEVKPSVEPAEAVEIVEEKPNDDTTLVEVETTTQSDFMEEPEEIVPSEVKATDDLKPTQSVDEPILIEEVKEDKGDTSNQIPVNSVVEVVQVEDSIEDKESELEETPKEEVEVVSSIKEVVQTPSDAVKSTSLCSEDEPVKSSEGTIVEDIIEEKDSLRSQEIVEEIIECQLENPEKMETDKVAVEDSSEVEMIELFEQTISNEALGEEIAAEETAAVTEKLDESPSDVKATEEHFPEPSKLESNTVEEVPEVKCNEQTTDIEMKELVEEPIQNKAEDVQNIVEETPVSEEKPVENVLVSEVKTIEEITLKEALVSEDKIVEETPVEENPAREEVLDSNAMEVQEEISESPVEVNEEQEIISDLVKEPSKEGENIPTENIVSLEQPEVVESCKEETFITTQEVKEDSSIIMQPILSKEKPLIEDIEQPQIIETAEDSLKPDVLMETTESSQVPIVEEAVTMESQNTCLKVEPDSVEAVTENTETVKSNSVELEEIVEEPLDTAHVINDSSKTTEATPIIIENSSNKINIIKDTSKTAEDTLMVVEDSSQSQEKIEISEKPSLKVDLTEVISNLQPEEVVENSTFVTEELTEVSPQVSIDTSNKAEPELLSKVIVSEETNEVLPLETKQEVDSSKIAETCSGIQPEVIANEMVREEPKEVLQEVIKEEPKEVLQEVPKEEPIQPEKVVEIPHIEESACIENKEVCSLDKPEESQIVENTDNIACEIVEAKENDAVLSQLSTEEVPEEETPEVPQVVEEVPEPPKIVHRTIYDCEVERAFGRDLPDNIVEKPSLEILHTNSLPKTHCFIPEKSRELPVPEPRSVPSDIRITRKVKEVELDPLQQAVASIMNVDDEPMEFVEEESVSQVEQIEEESLTVVEPEPVIVPEPVVVPEAVVVPEPVVVPEAVVVPEPVVVPEAVEETLPVMEPQPVAEPAIVLIRETVKKHHSEPKILQERLETVVNVSAAPAPKVSSRRSERQERSLKQPLSINVDETEKEKPYSPKVTIKPIRNPDEDLISTTSCESEQGKGSLKMTITKQSDTMHSILKIYNPDNVDQHSDYDQSIPTLMVKNRQNMDQHSPKLSTRSSKQCYNSPTSSSQRSGSPRITIKPVVKPTEQKAEVVSPLKITIKPIVKPDDGKKHSPKLTIKPIVKPEDSEPLHSPRITIKPIVKPLDEITITPKLKIKVQDEEDRNSPELRERSSPKVTIKPVIKPAEPDTQNLEGGEEEVKERIVLKINKGNLPTPGKESKKREHPPDEEKSEKQLKKIKLKFSKEGGHPHIVQPVEEGRHKRSRDESPQYERKKHKSDYEQRAILRGEDATSGDDLKISEKSLIDLSSPILISEDSTQDSGSVILIEDNKDPLTGLPEYQLGAEGMTSKVSATELLLQTPPATVTPPRKRGRPRKLPLLVREEFKETLNLPSPINDLSQEEPAIYDSGRPKRSCRGPNVRDTLGIKARKPRGGGAVGASPVGVGIPVITGDTSSGRGRGKRGRQRGRKAANIPKEPKLSRARLKLMQDTVLDLIVDDPEVDEQPLFSISKVETVVDDDVVEIVDIKPTPVLEPKPDVKTVVDLTGDTPVAITLDSADITMFEEETRMSADINSRAQTPAKQVLVPTGTEIEESQSSILSTGTTESCRVVASRPSRGRIEIPEPEGAIISANQLAEYYWGGNGPFMLQEQVAQFLGIKSFKRKYPGIPRRCVDMQERDFIRESGLASEAMCDLGLTAVNTTDILDIMYLDFQDKYEEYCKFQRERQAKDLTNKQKALSLAASQEKNKQDLLEQAVQSAATWNITFNKTRKDQRKAVMDLQTLTVHYPKGKVKQINKPKIGNYPVALVPGQFTDYYKEFTPTEINNLPLNTLCYDPIQLIPAQESEDSEDGSDSDSDCSTTSSGSSDSSSGMEDCKLCKPTPLKRMVAVK